jgi:hypothetical protein
LVDTILYKVSEREERKKKHLEKRHFVRKKKQCVPEKIQQKMKKKIGS